MFCNIALVQIYVHSVDFLLIFHVVSLVPFLVQWEHIWRLYIYVYVYVYMCICVVCVFVFIYSYIVNSMMLESSLLWS